MPECMILKAAIHLGPFTYGKETKLKWKLNSNYLKIKRTLLAHLGGPRPEWPQTYLDLEDIIKALFFSFLRLLLLMPS